MVRFRCRDLDVRFGVNGQEIQILKDVSFDCRQGEFLAVLGPSGCGKTTLLRTIAGLVQPRSGAVEWTGSGARHSALLVLQENSLFPWMTVLENAAFGLEAEGIPRLERERRAGELLDRVGLAGRWHAYPHQLSVGMKQRVAVIRCFLGRPGVMLMDEPFAAVDAQRRISLQQELLALWEQHRANVIFVTHDVDEAILLSDRVLVLGGHPAGMVAEFAVPLARPRLAPLVHDFETAALKRRILAALGLVAQEAACAG